MKWKRGLSWREELCISLAVTSTPWITLEASGREAMGREKRGGAGSDGGSPGNGEPEQSGSFMPRVEADNGGKQMKDQSYVFKIWKVLETRNCYVRYLKYGSSVAGRPDPCSENSLDEEEDSRREAMKGEFL